MSAKEFFETMFAETDSNIDTIADSDGNKGEEKMTLESGLSEIKNFCEANEITPEEFFASAFGYTLSRFTGYSNCVFCIKKGNDVIPCAFQCGNQTAKSFLKKSAGTIRSCVAYYPEIEISDLKRNCSVKTNIIFASEKTEMDSDCDILFTVVAEKAELTHSENISSFVAERILFAFDRIVSGLMKKQMLSEIEYVSEKDIEEQEKLNRNDYELKYGNILEAFEDSVKKYPDNILTKYLDKEYTYSEGDKISDFIANNLKKHGIKTGDRVAIFVSRSEMYLLSALGVLKAGGMYVPIDESHPDERVEFMVSDSSSKIIITNEEMKTRAEKVSSSTKTPFIVVSPSDSFSGSFEDAKITGKDGCVILYTSGTTGKPKGSYITHLALINLCEWYTDTTKMDSKDIMGMYTSFSFDMHAMAIFPPIIVGSSVDVIPQNVRLDLRLLGKYITEHKMTHCFMTTHVGKMYMTSEFHNLKVLYLAGEKVGEFKAPEALGAYDGYGPSENLAVTTSALINGKKDYSSVGVPNYNMKVYVLDAEKRRVPIGAVGELYISGYQLSLGYLNREDANKKSFFKNPYSNEKWYDRIYASGDFFRYLPDGTLGILGRRDGQVKIRGNRVELTEVEVAIKEIKGVRDVTVQPVVNSFGAKELCAYIVSDGKVSEKEVQDHIRKTKPAFMVPYSVLELEKIPLNTNGKIDKRALPKPFENAERKGELPENEMEKQICEIFASVLDKKPVFADDDFFLIGGTSISAIKVVQECFKRKINVTYGILFNNPTPRKLAQYKPGETKREKWNPPKFLGKNRIENAKGNFESGKLGKVFLAGANGFLGSHILRELLDEGAERIYCLVKHTEISSKDRFAKTMGNYFPNGFTESELNKIEIVDGNINDPNLESLLERFDIDTIINCAAVVKYFATGNIISKVNVDGSVALAEIAKKKKIRYVHASTMSTIGAKTKHTPDIKYGETTLDYGQGIPNMYVSSKIEAEKKIMEMMENGLDAKILRFGNLMPRWSDGKFQPNAKDNGYMMMLNSAAKFGFTTKNDSLLTDLTPVDYAAKAAVMLSRIPSDFTVFHLYNSNVIRANELTDSMISHGAEITYVGLKEFYEKFDDALKNNPESLLYIIPFVNTDSEKNERGVECYDCAFTSFVLEKLGFEWPSIDSVYLGKIIDIALDKV